MNDQKKQAYLKPIALGIGAVSILMLIAFSILAFLSRHAIVEFLEGDFGYAVIIFTINSVASIVLGLMIISRDPGHVLGWLFLATGFLYSWWEFSAILLELIGPAGIPGPIRSFAVLGGLAYIPAILIPFGLIPLFFPDGRLPSRRWWPVLAIVLIGMIGQSLTEGLLDLGSELPWFGTSEPESFLLLMQSIFEPILILGIVGALASLVVRFVRSRGAERAQMKWLVYTAVMSISMVLLISSLLGEDSRILAVVSSAIPIYLTIAIGIGILRYRLFDIDIIIRRTLVYGALTAILVALYFGLVVLLQNIVTAVGGQQSTIAVVISTLIIAALFNPLRRRIQDAIDRRFYRRRYNAEEALAGFSLTVREEVDLENLSLALLSVVDDTMQPESVSVWLKERSE